MNSGYNLVASNWIPVGDGSVTEVSINDIFSAVDSANFSAQTMRNAEQADQIMLWNGTGFTTYYYCSNPQNSATPKAWCIFGSRAPADVTIDLAKGFWFLRQGEEPIDVTVSGQVSAESTISTALANGYNIMGSGFPVALSLNDPNVTWTGAVAQTMRNAEQADQIMVQNGTGFTTYYYCSNPQNSSTPQAWCLFGSRVPTDYAIPAGAAVWYLHQSNAEASSVQAKPY